MNNLLIRFSLLYEGKEREFEIYGNVTIETNEDIVNESSYPYPEFNELTAKEILKDGKSVEYVPTGHTFTGHQIDEYNMIMDVLSTLMFSPNKYKVSYMHEELHNLLNAYTDKILLTHQEKGIPERILRGGFSAPFYLELMTDKFIYYTYDEACVMLDTNSREVISDNYFASVGYFKSLEAIEAREETKIWQREW